MHNQLFIKTGFFFFSLLFPSKVYNKENFPEGKALIVVNHYSAVDPCFMFKLAKKDIFFLTKKEALEKKLSSKILKSVGAISIDRENNDIRGMMNAIKILKENKKLVIFPEGTRNRSGEDLQEIKGGAGVFAVKTKTPIVPVMFYKKAKIFKRTSFLVGKPFELTEFYGKRLSHEDIDVIDDIIKEKMLETRAKLVGVKTAKKRKKRKCN